ncbi:DUF3857 domain-containing protein [Novosphingobium umbonatum]|uniref:DUF3857 domain-containing protein n=1 Tax=Novosphingobium umbonatum TaxID=1908524 RepID=A0A3S2VU15_9SPHN|nr:DUF3857 domain-containing protein [Novosphingobium umbonatum]RVU05796.1 DUF3857 domain-containing protein [Novosphingobium umbonatum]
MSKYWLSASIYALSLSGTPVLAADQPLYQPAPAWVVQTSLPKELATEGGTPPNAFDFQQRFAQGQSWDYVDIASRIASPEQLAQNSLLTLPWFPDKGDLIIHEVSILRGAEKIDLLAQGQKFAVLRREQSLEQQQLTGLLTATLAVEGLRVGDTLRLRASTTRRDPALNGHVQWSSPLLSLPARSSKAAMRLLWPKGEPLHWKVLANGVVTSSAVQGSDEVLNIALPAPKPQDMPEDAPGRYRHPPFIEASSFASWADVSKTTAPLYQTTGAIAPNSALGQAVARIAAQSSDPVQRTAAALRLVQDDVRYLALSMDGGNYIPQKAEQTWTLRYGDCKAKTLLLLAMLHAMQIEAEPVLASLGLDDLVKDRLPALAAFNHVFVRARVNGQSIWLDGTAAGTRLADLQDTPNLRYVLPVRKDGADLEEVERKAPARSVTDIELAVDESSSIDLPSVIDAKVTLRGQRAITLSLMANQMAEKEKGQMLHSVLDRMVGEGQFTDLTMQENKQEATVTITGRGLVSTSWRQEDNRRKRDLSRLLKNISFAPDRARAAWTDIPVVTPIPDRVHIRTTLRLPDGGRGYNLEGTANYTGDVAGYTVNRQASLTGDRVVIEESLSSRGAEISPARIPAERALATQVLSAAPRLLAPQDATRRWNLPLTGKAAGTQLASVSTLFAKVAGEAEPEDSSALQGQASFQKGIGDYTGAIASWTKAIAKEPSGANYLNRAELEAQAGDLVAAAKDAEAARALDPSDVAAVALAADIAAKRGDLAAGVAMLDERISVAGQEKDGIKLNKAALIGQYGDADESLAQLDALIAKKPGRPDLLNARCWVKASRQVQVESALKDCTSAIELTDNSAPILDSRAVVLLRLGRLDAALADLDAALLQNPSQGETRLVRAIILKKLGRLAEAQKELLIARRLKPDAEKDYQRFGLAY